MIFKYVYGLFKKSPHTAARVYVGWSKGVRLKYLIMAAVIYKF